ncbi:vWA domain-containing protein [Planktothricoides raciborskii]|uniref:VWA domain-containing protein n=1 Tax=Planktothricoides raciborskii GIHE-MW2 TaxID=2792601 RepID=A0AAU8JDD1_9CYAN
MPLHEHQPVWRYAIFQISAACLAICLVLAILAGQLGWFPRLVAVHLALDLSGSTYDNSLANFNKPGTIMAQEIEAVKAYATRNAGLSQPNLISVSGFASSVVPITSGFSSDPEEITRAINQVVQPSLANRISGGTNINLAVENGLYTLKNQPTLCTEILVITDGVFTLEPEIIEQVQAHNVRLNFLIVGQPLTAEINQWANQTGGIALEASSSSVIDLLSETVFNRFNASPLVSLFYGLAFISFMWMILLPLERFLDKSLRIRIDYASKLAVYNAMFWTVATPIYLIASGLFNPFQSC